MNLIFGIAALFGLFVSLVVHVSALLGIDVSAHFPYVWSLHVGIFVVFFPFILSSRNTLGAKPTLMQIRAAFPSWIVLIGAGVFAYAVGNFLLFMAATEGGNPEFREGKYLLLNHGNIIRELTAGEYAAFSANQIRGFSGHWLVFYFVPCAYFLFRKQQIPALGSVAAQHDV